MILECLALFRSARRSEIRKRFQAFGFEFFFSFFVGPVGFELVRTSNKSAWCHFEWNSNRNDYDKHVQLCEWSDGWRPNMTPADWIGLETLLFSFPRLLGEFIFGLEATLNWKLVEECQNKGMAWRPSNDRFGNGPSAKSEPISNRSLNQTNGKLKQITDIAKLSSW